MTATRPAPKLELSAEIVEQRIHEVAALNRLCHALATFGEQLRPVVVGPEVTVTKRG